MAMSVYMQLQRWGITIPEQISVIGFDDYTLISELLSPRLTTVKLPYVQIGEHAAELLIERIKKPRGEKQSENKVSHQIGPVVWRHSVKDLR